MGAHAECRPLGHPVGFHNAARLRLVTRFLPMTEAPAEVPGGGGVGEALGPQAVEEHRVAAAGLDVLKASPPAQGVVGLA
jgi:hypothetical protein